MGAVYISLEWYLNVGQPKAGRGRHNSTLRCIGQLGGAGALCLLFWFYFEWLQTLRALTIQVKELVPVVVAAALFGGVLEGEASCVVSGQPSCC